MAINERLIDTAEEASAAAPQEGLILHLDANDVDSYDGDGSVWYDIKDHDVTIPLSDNADELELHLNASDSNSYGGSGTTWTDISGNSRNATIGGGFESTFDKDSGGYFHLDGSDADEATVSHNAALDITPTGFTVEAWVNPDDTNYNTLVAKFSTSASIDGYSLAFNSGDIFWRLYTSGSSVGYCPYTTGTVAAANTWHYIVGTVSGTASGSTMKLYRNGELLNTATTTGTYVPTTRDVKIGGYDYANARNFDGKIGAVRIYSKVLSASEVGQNYRHGRDYIYTDLIPDTDLELHLDPTSYSGSGSTWTADTGNDATINGAAYDQELGDWFDFDGSNDYISVPSTSSTPVDFSAKNYTIEAWINPDTASAFSDPILSKYGGSDSLRSINFNYASNGKLRLFERATGTNASHDSTSTLTPNRWTHVAVTRTSSQVKLYIDGSLDNTISSTFTPNNGGSQNINIGSQANGLYNFFDGQIGQVRVYDTALTGSDIGQNFSFTKNDYPNGFNGAISGATWNPSGYFSFDGSNDIVKNASLGTAFRDKTTLSISAWFNTSSAGRFTITSFSTTGDASTDFWIGLNSGENTIGMRNVNDGTNSLQFDDSGGSSLRDGNWHHVVFTADSGGTHLYVDDNELTGFSYAFGSSTTQIVMPSDLNQFAIGANTDSGGNQWFMNGQISDVKVFDKALTGAEVTAQYNIGYNGIG